MDKHINMYYYAIDFETCHYRDIVKSIKPPAITNRLLFSPHSKNERNNKYIISSEKLPAVLGKWYAWMHFHYVLSSLCPSPPTSPVSYSSSASCSSTTLAKLLALDEERERSWASGMDGALQHIAKLHTWVTLTAQTPACLSTRLIYLGSTIKKFFFPMLYLLLFLPKV